MVEIIERWPQRERFNQLLEEWMARTGKGVREFAMAIGKSDGTVYSYMSRRSTRPPEPLGRMMAEVLGCRLTELYSYPGATIAGQPVKGLTEREQVLAELLFAKYRDPDLTEPDRQMLFEDWMRDYDRLKAMKARHTKGD